MERGGKDRCRVYLITPERFDPAPFAKLMAAALDGGDVAGEVRVRLVQGGQGADGGEVRLARGEDGEVHG